MKKEEKKFLIKSLVVSAMVLTLFAIIFLNQINSDEPIIGGDLDEHGCLGPAGYLYDEEIEACTRPWELDSEMQQIAKSVVDFFGKEYALSVDMVALEYCENCFSVILTYQEYKIKRIDVIDGKIKEMTIAECESIGGTPVNIIAQDYCEGDTYNAGKAVGFIPPNICCVPVNDFDSCIQAGYPSLESYPRQCNTPGGRHFVEELE